MKIPACIWLCPEDRARLERLVADRNTSRKVVWRSRIVLLSAEGHGTMAIMQRTGTSKPTVWRWQERYLEAGVDGLLRDKSRPPGKAPLDPAIKTLVLTKTMRETPAAATHWSVRSMARAVGIPSGREGFPRVVAEAMASGLPVVTTDFPENGTVHVIRLWLPKIPSGVDLVPLCQERSDPRDMMSWVDWTEKGDGHEGAIAPAGAPRLPPRRSARDDGRDPDPGPHADSRSAASCAPATAGRSCRTGKGPEGRQNMICVASLD